jgi:hypothetical protein
MKKLNLVYDSIKKTFAEIKQSRQELNYHLDFENLSTNIDKSEEPAMKVVKKLESKDFVKSIEASEDRFILRVPIRPNDVFVSSTPVKQESIEVKKLYNIDTLFILRVPTKEQSLLGRKRARENRQRRRYTEEGDYSMLRNLHQLKISK